MRAKLDSRAIFQILLAGKPRHEAVGDLMHIMRVSSRDISRGLCHWTMVGHAVKSVSGGEKTAEVRRRIARAVHVPETTLFGRGA